MNRNQLPSRSRVILILICAALWNCQCSVDSDSVNERAHLRKFASVARAVNIFSPDILERLGDSEFIDITDSINDAIAQILLMDGLEAAFINPDWFDEGALMDYRGNPVRILGKSNDHKLRIRILSQAPSGLLRVDYVYNWQEKDDSSPYRRLQLAEIR